MRGLIHRCFNRLCWVSGLTLLLVACATPTVQSGQGAVTGLKDGTEVILAEDGYALPFTLYPANEMSRGLIIALHGFNDYKHAFVDLCRYFQGHQYDCMAYDQRGFGESAERGVWPGEGKHAEDLAYLVESYSKLNPQRPIYLFGESMGGAVIVSAWARFKERLESKVSGTVLFAPAVWARQTQPWYQRMALWLAVRLAPAWSPTGQGLEIRASDNDEALIGLGRDPLVIKKTRIDAIYGLTNLMDEALEGITAIPSNTLYLYGLNDQVIPAVATCSALARLESAGSDYSLRIYDDGFHMLTRDLDREKTFADVLAWMESSHASKPSTEGVERLGEVCD